MEAVVASEEMEYGQKNQQTVQTDAGYGARWKVAENYFPSEFDRGRKSAREPSG